MFQPIRQCDLQVVLARVVETGEVIVLKSIHVRDGGRGGLPDNVVREVKALQSIDHPNVISLRDLFARVGLYDVLWCALW